MIDCYNYYFMSMAGTTELQNKSPALDAAHAFIASAIAHGRWKQGDRLPTTAALAAEARVSLVTMCKALAVFKKQRLISARTRRGLVLEPDSPVASDASKPPKAVALVSDVARRLLGDIMRGRFPMRNRLPSRKELAARYGICTRSVTRALQRIESDGIIERSGRHFRQRPVFLGKPWKTVVLVLSKETYDLALRYGYMRNWLQTILYALERECAERNLALLVKQFEGDIEPYRPLSDAIGFIAFPIAGSLPAGTPELLELLSTFRKPLFIGEAAQSAAAGLPCYRIDGDNEAAGFIVGAALVRRGHRRIRFFAVSRDHAWSESRLAGIRRAYVKAGVESDITEFYEEDYPMAALPSKTEACRRRSIARAASLLRNALPLTTEREDALRRIEAFRQPVGGDVCSPRLYEEALMAPGVTAWIAANDFIATRHIVPALEKARICMGRDLSVVAFDYTIEAFYQGISSYSFDLGELMTLLVNLMLYPGRGLYGFGHTKRTIKVPGHLVERASLSTPRTLAETA
jgi:DNA-binding transcriptional regulator YhcF (GntR family)/DNA-binding LacI/PurR family transcriptional regulator